jgi:hypothetical protein
MQAFSVMGQYYERRPNSKTLDLHSEGYQMITVFETCKMNPYAMHTFPNLYTQQCSSKHAQIT